MVCLVTWHVYGEVVQFYYVSNQLIAPERINERAKGPVRMRTSPPSSVLGRAPTLHFDPLYLCQLRSSLEYLGRYIGN